MMPHRREFHQIRSASNENSYTVSRRLKGRDGGLASRADSTSAGPSVGFLVTITRMNTKTTTNSKASRATSIQFASSAKSTSSAILLLTSSTNSSESAGTHDVMVMRLLNGTRYKYTAQKSSSLLWR